MDGCDEIGSKTVPEGLDRVLPSELRSFILAQVPVADYFTAAVATCQRFSKSWYLGLFPQTVIVPDDVPSINEGINRLSFDKDNSAYGLVLIRPGVYAESVRVTRNCYIMGLGARGDVVVEAPGWESALVFAGLGVKGFKSGEDARVINITFKCRNELMRGRCVYIVVGQPRLERCDVDGGVVVSGLTTAPHFARCRVRNSRGSGFHLTDHCRGVVAGSWVSGHKRNGLLVDRHAHPTVVGNHITDNDGYGIHIFDGLDHAGKPSDHSEVVEENVMQGNRVGDLAFNPLFVDEEEKTLDPDLAESEYDYEF